MSNTEAFPQLVAQDKKITLEVIRDIAEFYHTNGNLPNQKAQDIEENDLGVRLCTLKMTKKGESLGRWSPEYDEEAIKLNCPDMFKTT